MTYKMPYLHKQMHGHSQDAILDARLAARGHLGAHWPHYFSETSRIGVLKGSTAPSQPLKSIQECIVTLSFSIAVSMQLEFLLGRRMDEMIDEREKREKHKEGRNLYIIL